MIDIKLLRERPELFKESYKRMKRPNLLTQLNELIEKDVLSRSIKVEIDNLRAERNKLSKNVNELKKEGKDASKVLMKVRELPAKLKKKEEMYEQVNKEMDELLYSLPNIIHKDVPFGKSDKDNVEFKKWGKKPKFDFPVKNHVELLEELDAADFEASAKASGNGFYYLKGDFARLNQALLRYAMDIMEKKKYRYVEPPLMLWKNVLAAAVDVEEFRNTIYTIDGEDTCLIGTSEHAILGMHKGQIIDVPKKYYAYSMCFRKEIGAHGINEKGLWRTHQFNKVEQFVFCSEEDSWKYYDELLSISEEIFQGLELSYRIIELCTADLARWKARSCDIEVWRPTTEDYGEITSLSNCTDYQARKLNMRYEDKDGNRKVVSTLNNTALATSRILVAIAETYQQKDGSIKVPKVLVPYMNGLKVIKK